MRLAVEGLTVDFASPRGPVRAVDEVSLDLDEGRVLAVVGESGSGKSTLALALARLLDEPPARIVAGRVLCGGVDLLTLPPRALRAYRGKELGYVFQEPRAALNPVLSVGDQVVEAIRAHEPSVRGRVARERAAALLERVGIAGAGRRLGAYPHELSGGERQRAMIAVALAASPRVLVADEPTTALDAALRVQVLDLVDGLRRERGLAVLVITHDMGVVARIADRVVVLRHGRVVESGPVEEVLLAPRDPYTRALLAAVPRLKAHAHA